MLPAAATAVAVVDWLDGPAFDLAHAERQLTACQAELARTPDEGVRRRTIEISIDFYQAEIVRLRALLATPVPRA